MIEPEGAKRKGDFSQEGGLSRQTDGNQVAWRRITVCAMRTLNNLNLSNLDLSSLPDSLMDCARQLTSIDLTGNPDLTDFSMLDEHFPHLKSIKLGSGTSIQMRCSNLYRIAHKSDPELLKELGLDTWHGDDKAAAKLLYCFRNRSSDLDLSKFDIDSIPPALSQFTWLEKLTIANSQIQDLLPLSALHKLTSLSIIDSKPRAESDIDRSFDIEPLKSLPLRSLTLNGISIQNPEHLRSFTQLEFLDLSNTDIKDLSPLQSLDELAYISLKGSSATDVTPLSYLSKLNAIYLGDCAVKDLTPLSCLWQSTMMHTNLSCYNSENQKWRPLSIQILQSAVFPHESLKQIDTTSLSKECRAFNSWIKRLINRNRDQGIRMKEWDSKPKRASYAKQCLDIIEHALKDPEFKDEFFMYVLSSMDSCSDRTLYYLNEMAERSELHHTKTLSPKDALPIFHKYYSKHIARELAKLSAADRNISYEEIEVILDFFAKLKDVLQIHLPFSSTSFTHHYEAPAEVVAAAKKQSFRIALQEEPLEEGSPLEWFNYLSLQPLWQRKLIESYSHLQKSQEALLEEKHQALESLISNSDNTEPTASEIKKLEKTFLRKELSLLRNYTLQFISSTTEVSDEDMQKLHLHNWEGHDDVKNIVAERMLQCLHSKAPDLNLSGLGLKTLPPGLSQFTWLEKLTLSHSEIQDLTLLQNLPNLKTLNIPYCNQETSLDISPLATLPIESLCLKGTNIQNPEWIRVLPSLKHLDLSNTNLRSLEPLSFLNALEELILDGVNVTDLSPLQSLTDLHTLSLKGCQATDAIPLSYLKNLKRICLQGSQITDLTPLSHLWQVQDSSEAITCLNHIDHLWKPSPIQILQSAAFPNRTLMPTNLSPLNECAKFDGWLSGLINQSENANIRIRDWDNAEKRFSYARQCLQIIQEALRSEEFREELFRCIEKSSDTYIPYYLNKAIEKLELHKTRELSPKESIPIFNKYYKKRIVRELAKRIACEIGSVGKELDVRIHFFSSLYDLLEPALPFLIPEIDDGLDISLEKIDLIKEELLAILSNQKTLKEDDPIEWYNYLSLTPLWQEKLITKYPDLKDKIETIEAEYSDQLPKVTSAVMSDEQDELSFGEKIEKAYAMKCQKTTALLRPHTMQLLAEIEKSP